MTRPYSEDLRERAMRRADAGETIRSIAAALQISPSCVSKWRKLRRETGGLAPLEFQNEVQHPRLDMISGRLEKPEECCSGNISSFEL